MSFPSAQMPAGREWIERRAKLFEAGEFPERDLTVTPEHLQALARGFADPVPVLIEHASSPLELGFLTSVAAEGDELFGSISLTKEADALIRQSGASALSIGLTANLDQILEVSLVENPRIESAQLFEGSIRFCGSLQPPEIDWQLRFQKLQRQMELQQAQSQVNRLIAEGRLLPSQKEHAVALLCHRESVHFGGSMKPVGEILLSLLELQPNPARFREHAPQSDPDYSSVLMMPEEAEFYRRHFPGVALEEIAKRK